MFRFRPFPESFLPFSLLLLLIITGCSSNPEIEKQDYFHKAMEYLKAENLDAAIIELKNAIQLDSKFADARYQLGLLYLKRGEGKKGFSELQKVADLDPSNLDAKIKTAEFLLISRDKAGARHQVEDILAVDPNHVEGLALLANIELLEGNLQGAEEAISKALTLAPGLDRLHSIQGRLYLTEKKMEEAEKAFRQAIKANPDKMANYQILLQFYQAGGQDERAEKLIVRMIDKFTDTPLPHILLASLYRKQGKLLQAEKRLDTAVRIFPDNSRLHLILADFYRDLGKFTRAEEAYAAAMAKAEKPEDVKAQLADFYFEQKKYNQARQAMNELLEKNPDHSGGRLIAAKFLIHEGRNREALSALGGLENSYPHWGAVYFNKALAHMNLGEVELARQAISEALRKVPSSSKYHTLFALLHLNAGEFEEAKEEASIALKLNAKNFRAALLLGKSVFALKDYPTAVRMYEEMRTRLPDNVEVLSGLGMAYLGQGDKTRAEEIFKQILQKDPGNTPALKALLSLAESRGEPLEKLVERTKALTSRVPDNDGHLVLLAELLLRHDDPEGALAALDKARDINPQNPRAYTLSALILKKQGKLVRAAAQYRLLIRKHPRSLRAYMGLGSLLEQQGDMEGAKKAYAAALEIKDDFAPAANNLAWILAGDKDPDLDEALRLALLAKQRFPDEVNIIDTLGWVHYRRKAYSLARFEFDQAVELQPNNPQFRYHLALALMAEGKRDQALAEIRAALELTGAGKEREEMLALVQQWEK